MYYYIVFTSIKFINHASVIVSDGNISILSDPWFSGDAFHRGWNLLHETSDQDIKKILQEEKQLFKNTNPPNFKVEFFKEQKNLSNINCYSNEGNVWEKSKTNISNHILTIEFREPFKPRRGRINCSLNDNGKWRWFGVQFPISEY